MQRAIQQHVLPPRQAGVCLHLSSLPGVYGIGDIGVSARAFVDTMQRMQLGTWQFLPLGPTAYGDSPYQPLSTFAGNEMLIDIGDLIQRSLLRRDEAHVLAALPQGHVDYGELIPAKSALLETAASRFAARASHADKIALEQFISDNDDAWLHDYALYRILKTAHGERPWPEWDAEFVHHDDNALKKLEATEAERIAGIKVVQFLFAAQWQQLRSYANEAGIRLFGDMPIYIALDSADAWSRPEILNIDRDGRPNCIAGVPPDYFSEDGQLWGNPLYDWQQHATTGYRWWIERMQASMRLADLVRIDHFRGFESFWSVAADAETAREGNWEPGPGDALFDAMRDALGALPIVAEDLGVITPEVEALRDRHGIPGMVVLQFEIADEAFSLAAVPENSVCYTGTHDNDTTLGWYRGSPDDLRNEAEILETQAAVNRALGGAADTVVQDMIVAAFATPANLAIAPLQDYLGLGSEARLNTPGTSSNNWRWRVTSQQLSDDVCDNVANMVCAANRGLENEPRRVQRKA